MDNILLYNIGQDQLCPAETYSNHLYCQSFLKMRLDTISLSQLITSMTLQQKLGNKDANKNTQMNTLQTFAFNQQKQNQHRNSRQKKN